MMETARETKPEIETMAAGFRALNDNRRSFLASGSSEFPKDARALIFKPSRPVTTSGTARTKGWRLVFERRSAPFVEPLMGYTGGGDTLTQVELTFPTLQSAIRYAERQGLAYVVRRPVDKAVAPAKEKTVRRPDRPSHAFADAVLERLGLAALQESYGRAMDGAAIRDDASGPATWPNPMDVTRDPALSLEAKRSILMNWAWTEYLADQATNEGMPENGRPSRLCDVEQALLALEREVKRAQAHPVAGRKAA